MKEKKVANVSGYLMLLVGLIIHAAAFVCFIMAKEQAPLVLAGLLLTVVALLTYVGLFVVDPNGSRVLTLFGRYIGTQNNAGFHWANPFAKKQKISLRARTLNGERLKINDSVGNPIEIAAIIVWQVEDTYEACFEVDNYEQYVQLQSETALRHTASMFPYDAEDDAISLRRNGEEVAEHLCQELNERLKLAGVKVLEARLSHLAYAPEIASVMLRRQQAAAIISARQRIVDGAVGMVEMALKRMEEEKVIELDDERKAAMVSNLMVVLCSDHSVSPVVKTGTLHA